jgi:hypothetical protein
MKKLIFSLAILASSCLAFSSCDAVDQILPSSDSMITVGSTNYNISFAFQSVKTEDNATTIVVSTISDGMAYDPENSKLTGTGVSLELTMQPSGTVTALPAGTYDVMDAMGDVSLTQGKIYAGLVFVKDGKLSSDSAFAKSGSLKVTKADSKYTLDFTGTMSDGTSISMYYSGPLIVAPIPDMNVAE